MFAPLVRRGYQLLIPLYPAAFRREFGGDMLLLFDSLVADRGILAATSRTSLDLIVTVPRYRLETVMTDSRATQVLTATIAGLLVLGFISPMAGLPWWPSPLLILAGLGLTVANRTGLTVANRTRLAHAIRTPDSSRRSRRLRLSALSAAVFAAAVVGYGVVIWDETASTLGLLLPSFLGTAALVCSAWFLVAGLLTPRSANIPVAGR